MTCLRLRFMILLLLALVGCARQAPPPLTTPERVLASRFTSVDLETFLALPDAERRARAQAADSDFSAVLLHRTRLEEQRRFEQYSDGLHGNTAQFTPNPADETVTDRLIRKLHRATSVDPSFAEAWWELGDDLLLIGDPVRARAAFLSGLRAAPHDGRPSSLEDLPDALRVGAAWACRDQGEPERGLALVLDVPPASVHAREALLLRGLLLADAGRFHEAWDVAMALEAAVFPHRSYLRMGFGTTRSGYQRRWIQACAWLGQGEPGMARHALGDLNMTQGDRPFMRRFWDDVGLVCELTGNVDEAAQCYGLALVGDRERLPFVPWEAYSVPPIIGGHPSLRLPFFTVFETNRYAGSPFAFAVQLMIDTANAEDPARRADLAALADAAWSRNMRRGVRPLESQALRGRTRSYAGDMAGAEADLREACAALAARGTPDGESLMLLGLLLLQQQRAGEAAPYLAQATAVDSTLAGAWRGLGAALATAGDGAGALAAMDRAVDLEPGNSSGWYNRGLLQAGRGRWAEALVDLELATRLAPWNQDARDLLQRAASELRREGRQAELAASGAEAARLAAANPTLAAGGVDDRPGAVLLGGTRGPREAAPRVDYAARAEELIADLAAADDPDLRRQLADAYLHLGRADEAAALVARAEPSAVPPLDDLLILLRADRSRGVADRTAGLVDRMDDGSLPDDPELWSLVALTCLDAGRDDAGRRALDKAVALDPANDGLRLYRNFLSGSDGR